MTVKSWMDAQRHKGGPVKYFTEGTILARIKALEDAS